MFPGKIWAAHSVNTMCHQGTRQQNEELAMMTMMVVSTWPAAGSDGAAKGQRRVTTFFRCTCKNNQQKHKFAKKNKQNLSKRQFWPQLTNGPLPPWPVTSWGSASCIPAPAPKGGKYPGEQIFLLYMQIPAVHQKWKNLTFQMFPWSPHSQSSWWKKCAPTPGTSPTFTKLLKKQAFKSRQVRLRKTLTEAGRFFPKNRGAFPKHHPNPSAPAVRVLV